MRPEIPNDDAPVELPMDGVLDLHTFRPRDVGDLVPEWLAACQERGLLEVRIVHGKGIGNLQRSVHAILARHPGVGGGGRAPPPRPTSAGRARPSSICARQHPQKKGEGGQYLSISQGKLSQSSLRTHRLASARPS
jgi:hypothetical protein